MSWSREVAWRVTVVACIGAWLASGPPRSAAADPWPPAIVSVESFWATVDSPDPLVKRKLQGKVEVVVKRLAASFDPETGQARWPHWIGLKNHSETYALHLTLLTRHVRNTADFRPAAEGGSLLNVQEFKLDMLRADLHLEPSVASTVVPASDDDRIPPLTDQVWFPCAERLGAVTAPAGRNRQGRYSVWRTYTGDVTFFDYGPSGEPSQTRFAPVTIAFWIDFELPGPDASWSSGADRRDGARRLEWAGITDRCETCRAVIICESLRHAGPFPRPRLDIKRTTKELHVVAGFEKRSVVVDPSVAESQRTVFCTRWQPKGGKELPDVRTDGTEEGLAGANPYLTFHHVMERKTLEQATANDTPPPTKRWTVTLLAGEVLDPVNASESKRVWDAWEKAVETACTTTVWQTELELE